MTKKANKIKKNELVHLGIRIPSDLKNTIEQMSESGHRRFSDEVRLALENHAKAVAP